MDYFVTDYCLKPSPGADSAVLEDSIMHKGRLVTAGSKILENFISPLDATVVARLDSAGIGIIGKTKMDEFGAGTLFLNSESEIRSPDLIDKGNAAGISRSSSGAVSAVADGIASFALCNDYTGAVGFEAATRGICYIHPTYGTVSRYGLIPAVPSMDQIGVVCKTPADGARVLSIIAGYDSKDGAMLWGSEGKDSAVNAATPVATGRGAARQSDLSPIERLRIGVPVNVLAEVPDSQASVISGFSKAFDAVEFELQYFGVYTQVMQILCCAELSNNISRYDGVKYGYRADEYNDLHELYTKSRTEAFGHSAKLAALIGSMVLSQENYLPFYDKAMRIRRLIKESLEFDKYDVIILPCDSSLAFHALPRLCGLPAVTVPLRGGGATLIANINHENVLLTLLNAAGTELTSQWGVGRSPMQKV